MKYYILRENWKENVQSRLTIEGKTRGDIPRIALYYGFFVIILPVLFMMEGANQIFAVPTDMISEWLRKPIKETKPSKKVN